MSRVLKACFSALCAKCTRRFKSVFVWTPSVMTAIIILIYILLPDRRNTCRFVERRDSTKRPNILFVVVDDFGWNDFSWNNPDVRVPVLERFSNEGIVLTNLYLHPATSPTHAAMLTGYYSHKLGLQHRDIGTFQTKHVPKNIRLLPEELKELGYMTHMIGKWNLGHCNWNFTPTSRGFDTFYGSLYSHYQNPYTMKWDGLHDFWEDREPILVPDGAHSTDLYFQRARERIFDHCHKYGKSKPLFIQVGLSAKPYGPSSSLLREARVKHDHSAENSNIIKKLDTGLEDVLNTLYKTNMLDETLVVVTSGSSGDVATDPVANSPLRGGKRTLWEGGSRVNAVVQGRMIRSEGLIHSDLFHAVDWFPTLLHAAGKHPSELGRAIDGISHWDSIRSRWSMTSTKDRRRDEILYSIDDQHGAVRVGDYKFILGNPVEKSYQSSVSRLGVSPNCARYPSPRFSARREHCHTEFGNRMLFDVADDPTEEENLLTLLKRISENMEKKLEEHRKDMVPAQSEESHEKLATLEEGVLYPGWC